MALNFIESFMPLKLWCGAIKVHVLLCEFATYKMINFWFQLYDWQTEYSLAEVSLMILAGR